MCWEISLLNSTIQTIWTKRIKIIGVFEQNGLRIVWFQKNEWSDVDEAVLECFKQERSDSIPMSGPLFMINEFFINFTLMYRFVSTCVEI
jgi:hypothetical protein